jgi:TfoX/Sxy family transcriptional regulator of competence genes
MAFDEALAGRIRQAFASRHDVEEKRMFGGIAFMVAGRMCCGVHKDRMILRLPVDEAQTLLQQGKVLEFDMQSRPIRGFVMVEPGGCATPGQIEGWLQPAIRHALAGTPGPSQSKRTTPRPRTSARERPAITRQGKARAR